MMVAEDKSSAIALFDKALVRAHIKRSIPGLEAHGFLLERTAADIADRLLDVERRFDPILLMGVRGGFLERALSGHRRAGRLFRMGPLLDEHGPDFVGDDEVLPVRDEYFDAAISFLSLHWANDLPGALVQIRRALKPDGLFLGTLFGGDNLMELRQALATAEVEIEDGLSPRVAPFVETRDGAALLQRAGFALPVADRDCITASYETPIHLMRELRAMGESNALIERRRKPMTRRLLARACAIYQERFALPDGRVRATFDILTLTGWAPHERQQKPLAPGSAKMRLADALGAEEIPAPDNGPTEPQ